MKTKSSEVGTSSQSNKAAKPKKPHKDFPLFAHASGRWAKKVKGRFFYFGYWRDDPKGEKALELYESQRADLYAGRTPKTPSDQLTLRELVNRFLTSKKRKLDTGELKERSFADYMRTSKLLVDFFGRAQIVTDLTAEDFERFRSALARKLGPVTLNNEVTRVRMLFKYGFDAGLLDRPVRYGQGFDRPSRKMLRVHKQKTIQKHGKRRFEPHEIRALIEAADPQMKAMVLLAINSGLGNTDLADMPISAVDFEAGWLDYPRPKTGIERRCPLWPETLAALRDVLEHRQQPHLDADADVLFLTKYRRRWVRPGKGGGPVDAVSAEFTKLASKLGINGRRGFYVLRHTHRTVAGGCRDERACDHVMGHVRNDMGSVYTEEIDDNRLRAVVDHVHRWLFGDASSDSE